MGIHLSMNPFEPVIVNVFEIETKKIVFTGRVCDAAKFTGCKASNVSNAAIRKTTLKKKKYAIRYFDAKNLK